MHLEIKVHLCIVAEIFIFSEAGNGKNIISIQVAVFVFPTLSVWSKSMLVFLLTSVRLWQVLPDNISVF